ncbi:transposable element Tc3 transposase [Trichonephila clavata]|uniref:Transposable element Tc3 transposase n=1 Tax=Trichonephila clavata TaxID=2740835 RepID=A0A8X6LMH5_TRICU|nr:transposable element Tc3 transposase [Trichonephila clavata]
MTSDIPFPTDVPNCQEALKEERKQTSCAVGLSVEELPIISRVSSFRKLQRVLAWFLRFISNAKLTSTERKFGALTTKELEKGLVCCIKQVQVTNFASELKCLQRGKPLPANSRILNLYPFIDNDDEGGALFARISQNRRYWSTTKNPHIIQERSLHNEKACAVSRRQIVGPLFFGSTVDSTVYINIIMEFVSLLNSEERYAWLQQDGATWHTSREKMEVLTEFFNDRVISKGLWPPSPDLSIPIFFLWG